jgi:hypothetical protein
MTAESSLQLVRWAAAAATATAANSHQGALSLQGALVTSLLQSRCMPQV